MDITTILVALLAGLLTYYVISWYLANKGLPPSPSMALPVIGHLHKIDPSFSRESLEDLREKLGDIYSFRAGPQLMVVINGYENIKEAFVKKADDFSGRMFFYVDWAINMENHGIVANCGQQWKEQRTVSLNILRNMGMGKNVLAELISEEVEKYLQQIGQVKGEPQDIATMTTGSTSNVICSLILGQRFEYDDPTFQRILDIMNYNFIHIGSVGMNILNMCPMLHYLPGDLFNVQKVLDNREEFGQLFSRHFRDLKGSKDYDENNLDSYIANYVHEQKNREGRGVATNLNAANLSRCIEDLMGAGSDTTAITILWFVIYMLHYPDVQEKIFAEINDKIGTERKPVIADKSNLNYVNAAIFETQRIGNIAPMGVPHMASVDSTFKGYRIPKNATLVGNLSSVMYDKSIWGEDVEVFRPERFLDESGNLKHAEKLIPFSIGRRACPGEALARMELFLYISSMVQRYRLVPKTPGKPPKIEAYASITRKPKPFEVRVVDRRE